MEGRKKVVIFGGAFSPPTKAHEAIIAGLLELPQFDEVWVMPSGDRIDKDMTARDSDRMAMLELVKKARFHNEPRLRITDFELQMPRPSQTFQTVEALERQFPGVDFWFAYGPDSYISMPNWPQGTELQHRLKVVLFSSGGPSAPATGELIRLHISDKLGDTSSTEARRLIAAHQNLEGHVSQPVALYIRQHQLYLD